MKISDFTPAKALMLLSPIGVTGAELMKYTLLDLIYKGVLKVYQDWRYPHPRDLRERLYTFVCRGDNFNTYLPKYHERPFVHPFIEDNYEYKVRSLAKKVYLDCNKSTGFKRSYVYKELRDLGYFKTSVGLKFLNLFFLSQKGKEAKKMIEAELKNAEDILSGDLSGQSDGVSDILLTLGSNVLLLNNFDAQLADQLKSFFSKLDSPDGRWENYAVVDDFDTYAILFYSFLDVYDSFDTSFSSFEESFDFGGDDFGGSDYGGGDFGGGD